MPSTSKKQHKFMEAIAHNQAFAKKVGIPQSVGQDFSNADKGKTFKQGGNMKSDKAHEMHQARELRKIANEEEHEAKAMKRGGRVDPRLLGAMMAANRPPMAAPAAAPMGAPGMKRGGMAKMEPHEHMKMAHHHLKEAMKHGGHVKKMASGGMTTGMHGDDEKKGMTTAKMAKVKEGGNKRFGEHAVQERGHTRGMEPKMAGSTTGMKRGGKTHHKK